MSAASNPSRLPPPPPPAADLTPSSSSPSSERPPDETQPPSEVASFLRSLGLAPATLSRYEPLLHAANLITLDDLSAYGETRLSTDLHVPRGHCRLIMNALERQQRFSSNTRGLPSVSSLDSLASPSTPTIRRGVGGAPFGSAPAAAASAAPGDDRDGEGDGVFPVPRSSSLAATVAAALATSPRTPSVVNPQDLLKDLSCSLCIEVLVSPRTLPCGHSFCGFCLENWAAGRRWNEVQCPLCRQSVAASCFVPAAHAGTDAAAAANAALKLARSCSITFAMPNVNVAMETIISGLFPVQHRRSRATQQEQRSVNQDVQQEYRLTRHPANGLLTLANK